MDDVKAALRTAPIVAALTALTLTLSACGSNRQVTLDGSAGTDQAAGEGTVGDTFVSDTQPDTPPNDLAGGDGLVLVPNDSCSKAKALSWSGGKATTKGSTDYATDAVNLPSSGCTSDDTEGPDVFYKVDVTKGTLYMVSVTPTSGYNAAIYVLSGCSNPSTTCLGGADANLSGEGEFVTFTAPATGTIYIGVDSHWSSGSGYGYGAFDLTVKELTAPTNDSCSKATQLTFGAAGTITEVGTTMAAVNDVKLSSSGCTGNVTSGPDLFYKVALNAGKVYEFELAASGGWNEALYIFTSCSAPAGTCGAGMGADDYSYADEELTFKPTLSGTYYLAVSGRGAGDSGPFTLKIRQIEVGPASCATAKALTFTGTRASVKSSNFKAGSSVNLPSSGCTGDVTPGGDVFYKVSLTAGTNYLVSVQPDSGFNVAAYLLSACSPATCVAGADSAYSGDAETFTYKPKTSGTYTVGVDSRYSSSFSYSEGSFTLTVDKLPPLPHDTCAKAKPLTLSGGTVAVKGHTIGATDAVTLPSTGCVASVESNGRDVFYKVALTGGKSYRVSIAPSGGYDPAIYLLSGCSSPATSCLAGKDKGTTGKPDAFVVTPPTSGTYYIGVDSDYAVNEGESSGTFTLYVDEVVTPTNDTCATAKALTLSSTGLGTISGDSTMATASVQLSTSGCTGDTTDGPDLFYTVKLTAGKTYTITLTPADSSWDPALYVFTGCSNPSSTCQSGWGSDTIGLGTAESVTVTPTTSGPHIIAVDSFYTSSKGAGKFTLEVK